MGTTEIFKCHHTPYGQYAVSLVSIHGNIERVLTVASILIRIKRYYAFTEMVKYNEVPIMVLFYGNAKVTSVVIE